MIDNAVQFWIVVTGGLSIWLVSNPRSPHHHRGCIIGLLGQPCWLYTTLQHFQWGVLVLSLMFSASFIRGIAFHYFSKGPTK